MNFQNIKYGWVALVGVAIVGTTIYVTNNQRRQVLQVDAIEIPLAAYERCLATAYPEDLDLPATNRRYGVTPFEIVRDWVTSNGTERVTNAIGWQVDRSMMIELDAVIKELIPHFADTNFACTSINTTVRLTVTGVWDVLQIGDKTNKFTRIPAWTNAIATNWIVSYSSYFPSTNGVVTNICYTTDQHQSVAYAAAWTSTGGYVWVTNSDWPSVEVQTSNAPTYGDYPWQIYEQALVERYKVLNYLRVLAYPINPDDFTPAQAWNGSEAGGGLNFAAGPSGYYDPPPSVSYETFADWWDQATAYTYPTHDYPGSPKRESHVMGWNDGEYYNLELARSSARSRYEITGLPTNGRPYNLIVEAIDYPIGGSYSLFGTNWVEIYAASNSLEPEHFTAYFGSLGLINIPVPAAEQFPLTWTSTHTFDALGYNTGARLTCVIGEAPIDDSGKQYWSSNVFENFYYATNAYWE